MARGGLIMYRLRCVLSCAVVCFLCAAPSYTVSHPPRVHCTQTANAQHLIYGRSLAAGDRLWQVISSTRKTIAAPDAASEQGAGEALWRGGGRSSRARVRMRVMGCGGGGGGAVRGRSAVQRLT